MFVVITALTQLLAYQRYLIFQEEETRQAVQEGNRIKDRLKAALNNSSAATKTLAFAVRRNGEPEYFDSIAAEILDSNDFIDALQLTRGGRITHVHPLIGNEAVLGYDILQDTLRRDEALEAIERRDLYFAGPFELRQGGVAVVGRRPIYRNGDFWGFSVAIIKLSTLLKAADIDKSSDAYEYQLSKINAASGNEEFFISGKGNTNMRYTFTADIPDGDWRLYVTPRNAIIPSAVFISILGFMFSATAGVFAWYLVRLPERLNRLVRQRTSVISTLKNSAVTTIERVSDAFVSLDRDWCYTYMNKKAGEIFQKDPGEMIGKHIWTEFPEGVGQPFYHAYHKAMAEQRYIYLEEYYEPYDRYFENHIYPSPDGLSIYFRDVTEARRVQKQIEKEKTISDGVINSLPGVFYLYDRAGKFQRWNRNFELISGYSSEEIRQKHPLDFFDGVEKTRVAEKVEEVFERGHAEVEARFTNKSGAALPYYFTGTKVVFDKVEFLIGLGIDISQRVEAEEKLKEHNNEIERLTSYLQEVREEERTRISREIHDVIGQQLTAMKMDVSWIRKRIAPEVEARIQGLISLIDETIKTVRRISTELRPGVLDDLGLIPALEWQAQEFEKNTGIRMAFSCDCKEEEVHPEVATNTFRIFQEALTNIARHARATQVETHVIKKEETLTLIVTDDGIGFNVDDVKVKRSLGLLGMKERARLFGGALRITPNAPSGTVVTLQIPIEKNVQLSV